MKAIVLRYVDVDAGATANDLILRAEVIFCGSDVPGGVRNDAGPEENGLPIPIDITALNQYANRVEDALLARASALGLPALARTDCLFPAFTRGA